MSFPGWVLWMLTGLAPGFQEPAAPEAVRMQTLRFRGAEYDVIEVHLRGARLKVCYSGLDGKRLGSLRRLGRFLEARGERLAAATNAGIFESPDEPTGLLIENGRVLQPLNLQDGRGNFYLKPNGVFLVGERGARIVESSEFGSVPERVDSATQSGPLLLRGGKLNPRLEPDMVRWFIRNGVGVRAPDEVLLAVSRDRINLYDFAVFFRDGLACPDALYLDGHISKLHAPALGRSEDGDFAGLIAVLAPPVAVRP
jgi:uncharacterized protein YigE (DUF2233 family)